jgi:CheY-like chemotaxis protein
MSSHASYVLILGQKTADLSRLESLLGKLKCAVQTATSMESALDQLTQEPPCLVILQEAESGWSAQSVQQLRAAANVKHITMVALTDRAAPSWRHQDDNPGFDGFLVTPLSRTVLRSVVQSASVRQLCLA